MQASCRCQSLARPLASTLFTPSRASDVVAMGILLAWRIGKHCVTAAFVMSVLLAAAIYFACEFFVNGVEWVGHRFGLGATTTGTVLAAFGTALPESAVTFVAVVFGKDAAQKDIGVGAALGGPLVLATISYAVVGLTLLWNRKRLGRQGALVEVNHRRLSQTRPGSLGIFVVKVSLGLVVFALKPAMGVLFLAAYAAYLWREMRNDEPVVDECDLEPLKFRPGDPSPSLAWAGFQTARGVGGDWCRFTCFCGPPGVDCEWVGLGAAVRCPATQPRRHGVA